jgi:hypothetical protein
VILIRIKGVGLAMGLDGIVGGFYLSRHLERSVILVRIKGVGLAMGLDGIVGGFLSFEASGQ